MRPVHVTVIRYVDRKTGERVPKGTKGARRVKELSATYYATLEIDGRRRRVSLGTDDEAIAWEAIRRLQRQEQERQLGLRDAFTEAAAVPLAEHVDDWLAGVLADGTLASHAATMKARVLALAKAAGWSRVSHIDADSCRKALAALQDGGLSAQTRNHYLSHAKQFCRWLWSTGRLRSHPLLALKPLSVESDRRHDRRCPTDAEVSALLLSLETGPIRNGMSGPQRALGYKVAMATGFRAGELRSLTAESFDLAAGTVAVTAGYSKRRRRDVQPLPAWLVDELGTWFTAGGGLWAGFPPIFPGRLLKADLAAAGVPWKIDGQGGPLFFDFHALRHWYCTAVANQPGISPKTLMELTRHSTPELALRIYAKAKDAEKRAAAQAIPDPSRNLKKDV